MKKLLLIKIGCIIFGIIFFFVIIIGLITMIAGASIGYSLEKQSNEAKEVNTVVNNQIYASRYRSLLDKYLLSNGYVTLERLVFYLQTKYNVLDITNLSQKEWEQAYLENSNEDYKQMIPIKTICLTLKNDSSIYSTIKSGFNNEGLYIEKLNLCVVDGIDITESDEYLEDYNFLLYGFPLKDSFQTTSIVFEHRDIDLDLTEEEKKKTNFHSGWDFAVPTGTNFYSACDGTIKSIVNTQFNDLSYNLSKNSVGNYISVHCNNDLIVTYHHIQANSVPALLKEESLIKKGELLGRTSTTGRSTGPHLHLDLKTIDGKYLDVLQYINFE